MANLLLLVGCFVFGMIARTRSIFPAETPKVLNTWVLYVSLPALVLRSVHRVHIDVNLVSGAAALWLVFAFAAGAAILAVRSGRLPPQVAGAMALCSGLGNTAFVGLPLIEVLGGPETGGPASVIDQLGSFFAFSLLGIPFAFKLGGEGLPLLRVIRRIAGFPPFIAFVLAVALSPWSFPQPVDAVLARLADMLSPLALVSVGSQADFSVFRGHGRHIALGLVYKLGLAPAFVFCVLLLTRDHFGLVERVVIAQSAMAPMITAGVLASEHKLAPQLASGLIALGVPLSFVTVPAWWALSGLFTG
jgi:predicted permease